MARKVRYATDEQIRASRLLLGMKPDSVVNLATLNLCTNVHRYVSKDGTRWSTMQLATQHDEYLNRPRRKRKLAA